MGVQGLWTVLAPCARPIKLETLAHKRLAVDASIWIYQFLKAVRDKEGNALRNSHVVGFFRRICKLLFFGIKPIFVFDGGAPVLKRQTIAGRKSRREGRKDDAIRTAGRLLAMQIKRRAEEEVENRRREREQKRRDEEEGWETIQDSGHRRDEPAEEPMPANPIYVEELTMTPQQRKQNRTFRKQDPYHLPDLDMSIESMGAPNDPRIMSPEDLAAYAEQFRENGDGESNMSLYDFSKIDYSSPFFMSLPISDQYAILSAARLRSRLRMGLSKEQLAQMFPNRLDFSRFQIERVRERNELTQRLMNLNGMNVGGESYEALYGAGRIAGEKGREYVLVKNDGVEGGWVLGVVGRKEGVVAPSRYGEKHVDKVAPGQTRSNPIVLDSTQKSVMIGADDDDDEDDDDFEDVPIEGLNRLPKLPQNTVELELEKLERQEVQQAIRNSIKDQAGSRPHTIGEAQEDGDSLFISANDDDFMADIDADVFISSTADHIGGADPVREIDHEMGNDDEDLQRAIALSMQEDERGASEQSRVNQTEPKGKPVAFQLSDEESGDEMDLQAAMKASKSSTKSAKEPSKASSSLARNPFGGLLPFESLSIDFGRGLLSKKKRDALKPALDIDVSVTGSGDEGGFVKEKKSPKGKEKEQEKEQEEEEKPLPLPPWFAKITDVRKGVQEEQKSREEAETHDDVPIFQVEKRKEDVVVLSDDEGEDSDIEMIDSILPGDVKEPQEQAQTSEEGTYMTMGELADIVRAIPPTGTVHGDGECHKEDQREPSGEIEAHEVGHHVGMMDGELASKLKAAGGQSLEAPSPPAIGGAESKKVADIEGWDSEEFEWEASGDEAEKGKAKSQDAAAGDTIDSADLEAAEAAEDHFSDEDDQELLQQLQEEAVEHARFASSLAKDNISIGVGTSKPTMTAEDYERELKALRNQQKKDRRDADEVTHTMISECQELLRLFGLPYITAPMEAEAQCAELVRLGLVDGIVTDDSDCFLFGGTRVFKNMFNQAKYVECYLLDDLEKEFSLDRKKLISLAHLLGSDYTDGLPGVGPVTALELLTEFSLEGANDEDPAAPLKRFRVWWEQVQYLAGVTYNDSKDSKFKKKFRKANATKLDLPNNFPALEVDEAYLRPDVDSDPSTFQWGVPDLDGLRHFLISTVGWSQERCDEVLVPVVKDMNKRLTEGTQSNITRYFDGGVGVGAFAPRKKEARKSKRMDQAMQKLHRIASKGNADRGSGDDDVAEDSGAPMPISMKDAASEVPTANTNSSASRGKNKTVARKQGNGRKRQKKAVSVSSASESGSDDDIVGREEEMDEQQEVFAEAGADSVVAGKKRKKTTPKSSSGSTRGGRKTNRGAPTGGAKRARGRGRGRGGATA